jgi:FdhE protein
VTSIDTGVSPLERQHPEWKPWLAVVDEVLREVANPRWDAMVPADSPVRERHAPRLAGLRLELESGAVRRLLDAVIRIARRRGAPALAALGPVSREDIDISALFAASLTQDGDRVAHIATGVSADPSALQAIATLLPVPFLQACNRRWAPTMAKEWDEGYCPVCGAWPALVEVRGIERNRHFRCGRCGSEWPSQCLWCPYCRTTGHEDLITLVLDQSGVSSAIEACRRCRGYVKTFTKLQGSPAARVLVDDLASVELDIAAVERGYERPPGAGHSLDLTVG